MGGGTETKTTYDYQEVWSDDLIDSASFRQKDFKNPKSFPIKSATTHAKKVTVGAFTLSDSLRNSVDNPSDVSVSEENIPEEFAGRMNVQGGKTLYLGQSPQSPEIGDCRVTFEITNPADVSVIAQQTGETFQPYQTKAGDALSMLRMGKVSAEQMFEMAHADNRALTWMLRGGGAILMFVGLLLIMRPISVLADVLPILGDIAETGLAVVAGLLTAAGASLVIGIAWVVHRPLIGIPLLLLSVGAIVLLIMKRKRREPKQQVEFEEF